MNCPKSQLFCAKFRLEPVPSISEASAVLSTAAVNQDASVLPNLSEQNNPAGKYVKFSIKISY